MQAHLGRPNLVEQRGGSGACAEGKGACKPVWVDQTCYSRGGEGELEGNIVKVCICLLTAVGGL